MIINIRDKNLIKNYHICFHYKRNVHSFPSSSSTIPIYRTNFFPFFLEINFKQLCFLCVFDHVVTNYFFSQLWIPHLNRHESSKNGTNYVKTVFPSYRRSFKIASFVLTRRLTSDNTSRFIVASFLIRNVCSWNSTIRATLEKHIKKIEKNFSTSGRRFHSF